MPPKSGVSGAPALDSAASPALLSVAEALSRILATVLAPLETQHVPLASALDRTLALGLQSNRQQPPFAASAMDGYAIDAAALGACPARLRVVGVSAAGHRFHGTLETGEAVRIFTGAPLPTGADTVIIQENTRSEGEHVTILQPEAAGRHVRVAGLDFAAGEHLLAAGTRLGPRHLALAAAMNHPSIPVVRRPKIAILATGDELVAPGQIAEADQIIASNGFAIAAMVAQAGGEALDLGIAADNFAALEAAIGRAQEQQADVLITIGGASVGDHDLVQSALTRSGMDLAFWKVAMRPGKPLMHGQIGPMRVLGLPGNPVSAIVCALIFLVPLVRALCGDPAPDADRTQAALLATDLPANDTRQDYLRATLVEAGADAICVVKPAGRQDSSMLRYLAEAACLIVRQPHAAAAAQGSLCRILRFDR